MFKSKFWKKLFGSMYWGGDGGDSGPPTFCLDAADPTELELDTDSGCFDSFIDCFNRDDAATLGTGWTDLVAAGLSGTFGVTSGKAAQSDSNAAKNVCTFTGTDYEVCARITLSSVGNSIFGITARMDSSAQGYGVIVSRITASNLNRAGIFQHSGGGAFGLGSGLIVIDNTKNTFDVRFAVSGSTLSLYLDGVLLTSVVEPTYSSGSAGMHSSASPVTNNGGIDNFYAGSCDDFSLDAEELEYDITALDPTALVLSAADPTALTLTASEETC